MSTRGRPLAQLARLVGGRLRPAGADAVVSGIQQDSRRVAAGDLFVALRGATTDGMRFVPMARERGAAAVLVEAGRAGEVDGLPVLEVDAPRRALAELAAEIHARPSEALKVLGLTGTNGKTTGAHLLRQALGADRTGIVGTLGYRFGDFDRTASHTSPEADVVQSVLGEMRDRGADFVAMEVSSIALSADRVHAVRFAGALFTNLSQDHLDYHGSMEAYAAAKDLLFTRYSPPAMALNLDDRHGAELHARLRGEPSATALGYGVSEKADVTADGLSTERGIAMTVVGPSGRYPIESNLVGAHNVENLLGVMALLEALLGAGELTEADLGRAAEHLSQPAAIPGRLERCDGPGDDLVAVVDYAHTPDALSRILESLRNLTTGKLWCVFGCGGDRDPDKRAPMGAAVASGADVAIVTNDNPRSESPEAIAAAVVAGLSDADAYEVELDRAKAIAMAIERAAPGDVVLVAGKGHEPYQIIGDRTLDFDDRVAVGEALQRRRGGA